MPRIIWTIWETQIPEGDHLLKTFEFNHKLMQHGWELRHVDNTNMDYWLGQIPDLGDTLTYPEFKNDKPAKRTDLIRIGLIKQFGGVYIDYTIILTEPLDWLLNLTAEPSIKNKFGSSPNSLFLFNSHHSETDTHRDPETGQQVLLYPSY
jgi:mannosyltransferase OCH1-like enzyme